MSDSRGDVDLVGHNVMFVPEPNVGPLPPIDNIIVKATKPEEQWAEEAMKTIGGWRAKLRSTYIRWALAINALEVAGKKYADPDWARTHKSFVVSSLRPSGAGSDSGGRAHVDSAIIAEWDGPTASQAHFKTMPMLAAFGIIDLYANLEEVVFDLYKLFLNHNPEHLLKGDDFKDLRRLKREAEAEAEKRSAWESAWQERLLAWQRNKLYDGLELVFKAFCTQARLKAPSVYRVSSVETWAESIKIIKLVRNALVHGASTVSAELATACTKPYAMTFDFKEGQTLAVTLHHLQGVDLFCEQLLTALNLSLVEMVAGPLPRHKD